MMQADINMREREERKRIQKRAGMTNRAKSAWIIKLIGSIIIAFGLYTLPDKVVAGCIIVGLGVILVGGAKK